MPQRAFGRVAGSHVLGASGGARGYTQPFQTFSETYKVLMPYRELVKLYYPIPMLHYPTHRQFMVYCLEVEPNGNRGNSLEASARASSQIDHII